MEVSTLQLRIAKLSSRYAGEALYSLNHFLTPELLEASYKRLNKSSSSGVDGVSYTEYGEQLSDRLLRLEGLAKFGKYYAPAVKRVYIPKANGKFRPIGIPTVEDKVLQGGVKLILEPIYESEFYNFSYAFRPGRNQHQALKRLRDGIIDLGGCWILDLDLADYFGSIDHGHLRNMLDQRVRDGVLRRLIDKWLKAGIMEGKVERREPNGTPQGGVLSPLLSNIYLHEVLDKWFTEEVSGLLSDRSFMVRYADDAVLGFAREADALRVLKTLPKRLWKYGLKMNESKTKLVRFIPKSKVPHGEKDETFDFLGFTHYWGKSKQGNPVIWKRTAKDRYNDRLKKINEWCKKNRHTSLAEQHAMLCKKLRGHYNYYGVIGNRMQLTRYHHKVEEIWRKWLARRGGKKRMTWKQFLTNVKRRYPLPSPPYTKALRLT
jgi:group II intron reverse transcriptase/maturase